MIDANKHHDSALAPGLIVSAIRAYGTQSEVARRLGVSPRTLQLMAESPKRMRYTMQVALEALISEAEK